MQTAANRLLLFSILLIFLSCRADKNSREVIHAMSTLPSALLPAADNNINSIQIYSQIYETLLSLDSDFKTLKPNLCRSWQTNSDGKIITLNLRRGVHFHDGSEFNAASLKYSIDWLRKTSPKNRILRCIDSLEIQNDSTLILSLKDKCPVFIYALASPSAMPVISAAAIKKYGNDISANPQGSGPFRLGKWKKDESITLIKNNGWWKDSINIDRIVFKRFNNYNLIEKNLKQNKVDIVYAIQGYSLDRMKWMGKVNYAVNESIGTIFIGFNLFNPILKNREIRKALAISLNIHKIVNMINRGNADISNNPLPKTLATDNLNYDLEFNPEAAKKILADHGYTEGLTLNFYYPSNLFTRQTYLEAIKTAYKKVKISLNFKAFDSWNELEKAISGDSSQIFIYGWGAEILGDAGNFLRTLFYSTSKRNFFHYNNKTVDNILDKAITVKDKSVRDQYYSETVKLIMDDIPAVFLMHVKEFYAFNKEKIKSVSITPYGIVSYDKIILN